MEVHNKGVILKNVSISYGKHIVLSDINLEIKQGMFGLLGHNGAGKTTLMKLITTLLEPQEGEIFVNGYDIKKEKKKVRGSIGFLPQEFNIYPRLTALEFLEYISKLNNSYSKLERRKNCEEILEKVNLLNVKNKKVGTFSGGMKRRLGIAQALIKDPKILIVDEPTAGLDPEERIRFRTMLVELSRTKVVILSTHIVEDISASCEKIGLLDNGKLRYVGSPDGFINEVEGKVWEVWIDNRELLVDIKDKYQIISMQQTKGGTKLRIISNNIDKSYNAKTAEPNLEDAYMFFINKLHRGENYDK